MRRKLRTVLVGMLVVAMSVNPAAAWFMFGGGCGGFGGYGGYGGYSGYCSYAPAYYSYYSYPAYDCGPSYCGSYACSSGCWTSYTDDCCTGGCGTCDSVTTDVYESYDTTSSCASCGSEVVVDHGVSEVYSDEMTTVAPSESHAVPTPQEPAAVQQPAETTPIPALPPEPAPTTPSTTPPAEPATPPAEQPAANDLFGPESEPATTTPPAESTPPAEATPPAESSDMNDLFGAPGTESTPPAETTPPADNSAPAETTTTEPADADLFGAGDAAATESSTPPAESAPAGAESTPPADTAPAGGEGTEEAATDIFGSSHDVLREPGGLASSELRQWTDNTGKFSCRGRLVRFIDGKVRLLKDNGRTTTVALGRLCASDLEFVDRQASAQETAVVGRIAQSLTLIPLLVN